jgi:hypothetical protein
MPSPQIDRAVPQRRYQIGTFHAVVLGEVTSSDGVSYLHILALVPEGEARPVLYITAEREPEAATAGGTTVIRVVAESGEKAFGPDDRWQDLDAFAADALAMAQRVMGLGDEEPYRLL